MNKRNEEISQELKRARKSLKAAETLRDSALYEDSISRSYYAVHHASKAVLLSQGHQSFSHNALKRLFGLHIIKENLLDEKFARILREEQDDRILADYDSAFDPVIARVNKRIEDAEEFVQAITAFPKQNSFIPDEH